MTTERRLCGGSATRARLVVVAAPLVAYLGLIGCSSSSKPINAPTPQTQPGAGTGARAGDGGRVGETPVTGGGGTITPTSVDPGATPGGVTPSVSDTTPATTTTGGSTASTSSGGGNTGSGGSTNNSSGGSSSSGGGSVPPPSSSSGSSSSGSTSSGSTSSGSSSSGTTTASNPPSIPPSQPSQPSQPSSSGSDDAGVTVTLSQDILTGGSQSTQTQPPPAQPSTTTTSSSSSYGSLLVPVTPFSNMASGYQATNPGFRALLKDSSGKLLAAGPLSIESVINGYADDASQGSAYGRLVLKVDLAFVAGDVQTGQADGRHDGKLSLCMASDTSAAFDSSSCKSLSGNIHPERPFQWIDKAVAYEVKGDQIKIVSYSGETGEGGTRSQIALAVYHPAYGFAAPGKAFKDYQSPLVLDLGHDDKLDLVDVWDERRAVSFDLAADGRPVRTGWVGPEDGLLALDVDGDGRIDSGRELFGDHSDDGRKPEAGAKTYDNGFQALARYDADKNGRIDAKDPVFARLLVWRDANLDGQSQKDELKPLSAYGVRAIGLAYHRTGSFAKPLTVLDNEVRLQATYETTDGKQHLIADVWFKQRRGSDVAGK